MPILAGLLVSLFSGLADFFTRFFTKKVALASAAIAAFGAITAALYTALQALESGLVYALPTHPVVATAVWVALPDNAATCIAAAIAADTASALYAWNRENIRLAAYVT